VRWVNSWSDGDALALGSPQVFSVMPCVVANKIRNFTGAFIFFHFAWVKTLSSIFKKCIQNTFKPIFTTGDRNDR
jgi:hypothetical protein